MALWNDKARKTGKPAEVLPIEDDPGPPPLEGDGDDVVVHVAPKEKAKPKKSSGDGFVRRGRGKGGAGGGDPPAPPPLPPPPLPPTIGPGPVAVPPVVGVPEEDDDVVVAAPQPPRPPPRKPDDKLPWHDGLDGAKVRNMKPYAAPSAGGKVMYNWQLKCPRHDNCVKKRHIVPSSTARYGEEEPLSYLHAWIPYDPPEGGSHASVNPRDADVVAYAEAHRDALKAIVAAVP